MVAEDEIKPLEVPILPTSEDILREASVTPAVPPDGPVKVIKEQVVQAVAEIGRISPDVAELAVMATSPVPVYIPVLVMARSAPVVLVVGILTISFAVEGERVVEVLDQ